ncbi:SpoIIE family protein phosphatase [Frankia sp. QA3]|uniref:SpoIIE family protein phosphatase n=1 Tax=Frankia sp. QA3 TaxID=710111 RepID=UPI000269CB89|nr:SpoIIE family protein phosphatase [Frankia sp. QA3]EIV95442.1 SpoIIE-like protein with ANTAR and PAS domains [Frankia sp. QA3]
MGSAESSAGRSGPAAGLLSVIARQQRQLADWQSRAASDTLIDVATGVLVERLRCSVTEAGEQLRRLASAAGVAPADFAAEVLGQAPGAAARPPLAEDARRRAWLAQAAVGHATDGSPVAQAVHAEVLAPLGAVAVAFWMLEPDGALALVGEAGLGLLEASRWQRIPPQMDCAALRAARLGTPQWWPTGSPAGPEVTAGGADGTPRLGRWRGARAALPFLRAGAVVGAMEICWPAPRAEFPAGMQRELTALADLCLHSLRPPGGPATPGAVAAQTLDGSGALAARVAWLPAFLDAVCGSVLLAHAVRAHDGEVLDFRVDHVGEGFVDPGGRPPAALHGRNLLELYPLIGANAGLFDQAVEVLRTGEPFRADGTVLLTLVDDVVVTEEVDVRIGRLFDGIAISWTVGEGGDGGDSLLRAVQRLGRFGAWQEDVRTGGVRWTRHTYELFGRARHAPPIPLDDLDSHVHPQDRAALDQLRDALLRLKRTVTVSFRVLLPDGTMRQLRALAEPVTDTAGTLVAVRGVYQDLTSHYRTQVVLDATRHQLADSEARAAGQHRLALTLQRALLPGSDEAVEASGLAVAVRYRPAEQEHLVGGDWYDAVTLPGGDVLLVVGDVAGHSIRTVSGMVTLRNSLRGLAVTGAGPAQLLHWLNRVTYHLTDDITATVICGLYRPSDHTLRWARAGHLPPVLVRGGSASTLTPPDGLLLGVEPDATYQETVHHLDREDILLLFTDGLIERRGTGLDTSLGALLRIAAQRQPDVARQADHVLEHTTPDTDDDTCLIVIQRRDRP